MKEKIFALVDCNNFYVSCERVFNPRLRNKPVVVLSNNDGCVVSRSQEAKNLGISMAIPFFKIKDIVKKHGVIALSSNYTLYADMSFRVMKILSNFSPLLEIYSIDEAFMELHTLDRKNLKEFGIKIRKIIKQYTGIPVSLGIAPTKTLAKFASHIAKKNEEYMGVYSTYDEDDLHYYMDEYPVGEIWGIGRRLVKKLEKKYIYKVSDFMKADSNWIQKTMGISGLRIKSELNGIPCVESEDYSTQKSVMRSRSFAEKVYDIETLENAVSNHAFRASEKLREKELYARYLSVSIRTSRHAEEAYSAHNSMIIPCATNDGIKIVRYACECLKKIYKRGIPYRKAGVLLSDLVPLKMVQLSMNSYQNDFETEKLTKVMDEINRNLKPSAIKLGVMGLNNNWREKRQMVTQNFTTSWDDLLKVKAK